MRNLSYFMLKEISSYDDSCILLEHTISISIFPLLDKTNSLFLFCTRNFIFIITNTHVKTQRKVVSDFSGKIVGISPVWPLFFLWQKNFFFEFSEKMSNFFSMKLTGKKFRNFFNEFSIKKFRKFLMVNFRLLKKNSKFFYCWIHWKKFRKFFTLNFIEKKFKIFSENSKKNNFCHKKKGGGIPAIFPGKSDTTFCWALMCFRIALISFCIKGHWNSKITMDTIDME